MQFHRFEFDNLNITEKGRKANKNYNSKNLLEKSKDSCNKFIFKITIQYLDLNKISKNVKFDIHVSAITDKNFHKI